MLCHRSDDPSQTRPNYECHTPGRAPTFVEPCPPYLRTHGSSLWDVGRTSYRPRPRYKSSSLSDTRTSARRTKPSNRNETGEIQQVSYTPRNSIEARYAPRRGQDHSRPLSHQISAPGHRSAIEIKFRVSKAPDENEGILYPPAYGPLTASTSS